MNSYFRLVSSQVGTGIELIPPTDGGKAIDINELSAYLQKKRIVQVDIKQIFQAIQTLQDHPITVMLMPTQIYPENEMCFIHMSEDKMTVTARFMSPSSGGTLMDKREILRELDALHISHGIDMNAISSFLENRQYCTDYVLARGTEPRHGKDARIEYYFNTDVRAKPTRREDGSVDFFNLNTINHCKEGELLARLYPEDKGEYGTNVIGEKLKPKEVKHLTLKYGNNIEITEDKTEIYSKLNGHVMLTEDKVFVSDVYEVENVGTATGNIISEGNVIVSGNVQAGFSINAMGNVEVRGVVEGASIMAGGDIIIARGMNGMGKGVLKAGGRIVAKFFENATVEAGSYIEADSIMHSKVSAKTEVNVDGRKGFIAGGIVRATSKVSCKTLGSYIGGETVVEVGVDPQQKARYIQLQKDIAEAQKKYTTVQTTLSGAAVRLKTGAKMSQEQMQYIRSLAQAQQQMLEKLEADRREFEELDEFVLNNSAACICVRDTAYTGAKIIIGEESLTLKNDVQYSRFVVDGGEVRVHAL